MADDKLLCAPEEKANLEIRNQVTVAEYLSDFVAKGRNRITEGDILQIHALTIEGIYPCAGTYRDALTVVEITDTDHKPAHPSQVRIEVNDMLEWLYSGRGSKNPLEKAAYVLWKVNHIHPFNGGNGRVARAAAYLVMVMEVAPIFAGEPLPAKLKRRKGEYVAGLKAADKGNLKPLQQLVLECFQQQIADISLMPH
jgi:Fic family protein